jgi:hypothetical protein
MEIDAKYDTQIMLQKVKVDGNVFVLWVQKAVTVGVQKAATPCHGGKKRTRRNSRLG